MRQWPLLWDWVRVPTDMAAGLGRPPVDHPGGNLYHKQERHMIPIPRKMDRIEGWPLVVYMSSRLWLLAPESRDLSQAEKEKKVC